MSWQLATNSGIVVQENPRVWASGHVQALLQTADDRLLVGAENSGVWVVDGTGDAFGVSHQWQHPEVKCLATDHRGLYLAGCVGGLYQAVDRGGDPLRTWQLVWTPDSNVLAIAFFRKKRGGSVKAFVVIGTDKAVYWSPIPDKPLDYTWISTTGLPEAAVSSMVASGDTIHLAVRPYTTGGNFYQTQAWPGAFFRGSLTGDEMGFGRAAIDPVVDQTRFGRASIAVSARHPSAVWAVVADWTDDRSAKVLAVMQWRSAGIGMWQERGLPNVNSTILMGAWANRNQAIAVAANDPKRIAVACGTTQFVWISDNGGATFREPHEGDGVPCPGDEGLASATTHSDIHAILFDPDDPKDETFYVGSDGGVIVTRDKGCSFETHLNRALPTLQFYSRLYHSPRTRITAGMYFDGVGPKVEAIGGSLQDNGTVIQANPSDPWRQVTGGDGDLVCYVSDDRLLVQSNGDDNPALKSYPLATPANLVDIATPDSPWPSFSDFRPVVVALQYPVDLGHATQEVIAVAADGSAIAGLTHDLFQGWEWKEVARLPLGLQITSLATSDGHRYLAGCEQSKIFALMPGGVGVELPLTGVANPDRFWISKLALSTGTEPSYAVAESKKSSILLASADGANWGPAPTQPPGSQPRDMILDRSARPDRLYISRPEGVVYSDDGALTWTEWSLGLPRVPEACMLRIVERRDGRRWMYLSTWGWSVWRRPLDEEY